MRFLLLALVCHLAAAADFDPPLFAFQNGLRFANLEAETSTLKELGYTGVGSAKLPGLEQRIAAYKAAGLRVCSIYVGATVSDKGASFDKGIPKAIELLKGSGAVVELSLRGKAKTDEHAVTVVREVAALAAAADLKMVLYPHAGFYVARVPEALRVAKAVDRENVGIMFNLCHFLKSEKAADRDKKKHTLSLEKLARDFEPKVTEMLGKFSLQHSSQSFAGLPPSTTESFNANLKQLQEAQLDLKAVIGGNHDIAVRHLADSKQARTLLADSRRRLDMFTQLITLNSRLQWKLAMRKDEGGEAIKE